MPRPDASMFDARSPSRSLHLKIDGENRSYSRAREQVCEKWTLTSEPGAGQVRQLLFHCSSTFLSLLSRKSSLLRHRRNGTKSPDNGTKEAMTCDRERKIPCIIP